MLHHHQHQGTVWSKSCHSKVNFSLSLDSVFPLLLRHVRFAVVRAFFGALLPWLLGVETDFFFTWHRFGFFGLYLRGCFACSSFLCSRRVVRFYLVNLWCLLITLAALRSLNGSNGSNLGWIPRSCELVQILLLVLFVRLKDACCFNTKVNHSFGFLGTAFGFM